MVEKPHLAFDELAKAGWAPCVDTINVLRAALCVAGPTHALLNEAIFPPV